jgi:hypothetical protein
VATQLPYAAANTHLAQGDIFSLNLVAPLADDQVRILRTEEGLHGTHVLTGKPGRIFDYHGLIETVAALPPEQQELPFQNQSSLPLEYVVVFGDLVEYFMVASQTCDVSGVDARPQVLAAVVPIVSLAAYLSRQRLPIGLADEEAQDTSKWVTIVDYLQQALPENLSGIREDPFALPDRIRQLVSAWNPSKKSEGRQVRGKIRSTLNDLLDPQKKYIYYLPSSPKHGVPEGFVDFTRLYSVVTEKLNGVSAQRVCTLASPYREEFANKLGLYLSRIATPAPLAPEKM